MRNYFKIVVSFVLVLMFVAAAQAQVEKQVPKKKLEMKRFLVERTFPNGLSIPMNVEGVEFCLNVVSNNAEDNVTWIHSYVTKDKKKTFCIYEAPSKEAIRKAAKNNGLPVDNIIEVSMLDPFFYK